MATKKVGAYIKEARTAAKLTQEKLGQAAGVSAADIGKCERGEIDLTNAQLKKIAVACGVTQSSLLNAAKESTYTSAAKPAAASTAKKTAAASSSKKTAASSKAGTELTAAEKKLVELYRAADSETKKKAVAVLKGEAVDNGDLFSTLLGMAGDILGKK